MQLLIGWERRERDISGVFAISWKGPTGHSYVVLGSLAFYLVWLTHVEMWQTSHLPSGPPDSVKWEPYWWGGLLSRLSIHGHSEWVTGRDAGSGHPRGLQLPHPEEEGDQVVPTTFWTSRGQGSARAPTHWGELCPAPASWDLSQHGRNSAKPGCYLEPPLLGTGKPLKEARKDHRSAWTEEMTSRQICCVFFLLFFLFVFWFFLFVFIFPCPMLWLSEIL